jgi:uncharacterized protein
MSPEISNQHPIDPAVREDIMSRLTAIENEHHVKILFACESGSRGWGFASPDSDYDVRFVYVHALDWYLKVHPQRDVIEIPISAELDINGWELRKALALLRKGNATLIEWFNSPVVYRQDTQFVEIMQAAIKQTHQADRSFYHYIHMAKKNYREHLLGEQVRLKKYLYVLRPLLACLWIEKHHSHTPMVFQTLVDELMTEPTLRQAIDALLVFKRKAPESEMGPAVPVINNFIENLLERLSQIEIKIDQQVDFSILDHVLRETVINNSTSKNLL